MVEGYVMLLVGFLDAFVCFAGPEGDPETLTCSVTFLLPVRKLW